MLRRRWMMMAGNAIPSLFFTCTTTGAATLALQTLSVATGKTVRVNWGDGSQNVYSSSAYRSHDYAGAGTWVVSITARNNIVGLDLRDTKISLLINSINPLPPNLTYLALHSVGTWTVGPSAPMPAGLTSLSFLAGNITWTVNSANPMPPGLTYLSINQTGANLIWVVGPSAPMPTGLTTLIFIATACITWTASATAPIPPNLTALTLWSGLTNINVTDPAQWAVNTLRAVLYENALSAASVDAVLQGIWQNKANFTFATPTLDLLGTGNAAPNGVYQDVSPAMPSTGKEYAYDLVNGSSVPAGPEWVVTTA